MAIEAIEGVGDVAQGPCKIMRWAQTVQIWKCEVRTRKFCLAEACSCWGVWCRAGMGREGNLPQTKRKQWKNRKLKQWHWDIRWEINIRTGFLFVMLLAIWQKSMQNVSIGDASPTQREQYFPPNKTTTVEMKENKKPRCL